ncbi:hypothetical protein TGME49_255215 [Toxoplasma gondii ME49]|uniref:Uncharacterized protein n=11 Tax=Toxoplasma gondii TaxID=5811 RepID=B9Q2L4_TOXGV|nr:hypothetical protein TGME49_255215 [Toxoplasma gondii ME49]EPR64018.1 hypothetical protein TGGT1_255215 [Toxoplasma gondii GT1]ESS35477.1 hypothetical protein TGVEG_255215 [Toxoplasma gondii VEG]KFG30059.1 hypothetical protein TGDOM2_255215 [Toxoplasma gondii GAB2-2007-GAL-DOM2]KFG36953.1 hypothetical protein TGFOU_255215 [Toxoplasma gondii FOU]KFG57534.1 hypothetical protein TGRUB_255215 [Toxoplasma gondii RUB]KFH02746.1 hypothetical protein TGMAS_255215 [Toxoplasma gondii MAS]KYF45863.1|eukprot:XP_018636928.1 hypothetical protein TGME49_255215 [Toxoplasma gondii ME49]
MGDSTDRYARAYRYAFPLPFKAMDEKTNASLSLVKYCRLSTGLESEGDTTIECYATKSSFAALGLEGGSWGWISKASMHGDWPTASEKGRCHIVKLVAEQGVDSLPDKGCSGSAAQPPSESSSTLFARSGRQKGKSEEPRVFLSASLMHFLQLTSGKSFVSIRPFVPRPGGTEYSEKQCYRTMDMGLPCETGMPGQICLADNMEEIC